MTVRRLVRCSALSLAVAALAGCDSSGGGSPAGEPDGGGAGGADASAPQDSGPQGGGGAAGHDAGHMPGVDDTPPQFNGIKSIDALNEGAVRVSWDPAIDDTTAQVAMGYRVYRAAEKGKEDFSRKRRCGTALPDASILTEAQAPCFVSAVSGSTSAVVTDALPVQGFYYVARAVDGAGNEDSNTTEASFQTTDETPPAFGGVDAITALTATTVQIDWGVAFDSTAPDSSLVYRVYLKVDAVPNPAKDKPAYTSKPGEHTTVIKGLDPLTTYHTIVEATDPSGNKDDNLYSLAVTTPEGISPTFDGLKRASADGNTVRLFWFPASDNVTHPENIIYDVYSSLTQHREDFNKAPRASSAPGAASIAIQEVNAATRYFYVVRARDFAGNVDANNVEKGALTGPLPDTTPPTFNGAQAVTGSSPTSITVTWNGAADETTTDASAFTYRVYVSSSTPVPLKTPSLVVRGVLSGTVIGLSPGTNYNVVVLAEDAAGNPSAAAAPVAGATNTAVAGDTTAPALVGVPIVDRVISPADRLNVSWVAATDPPNAAKDIRYHVCVSATQSDCTGTNFAAHVAATTAYGTVSASISNLVPRTKYYVYVRSEDRAGNLETTIDHFSTNTTATSWIANAKPILFKRCVSCHNYDDASTIVNVGSSYVQDPSEKPSCLVVPDGYSGCPLKLVDPGRPQFSLVYRRVNPLGLTTPPFDPTTPNQYSGAKEPRDTVEKLSTDEDDILREWIEQGAFSQ